MAGADLCCLPGSPMTTDAFPYGLNLLDADIKPDAYP
jgi:hypothetical protein